MAEPTPRRPPAGLARGPAPRRARSWRWCSALAVVDEPAAGRASSEVVFDTPLAIVVLIVGTGWWLWRISRRRRPARAMIRAAVAAPTRRRRPLDTPRGRPRRASPSETWDVVIVGGGIVGRGALARRRRRAGCGPRSSSRTTSRRGRRRARRGSSTAACAISSSSNSAWSARRWPSGRGCWTSRRTSSGSSRCCSRSTGSRSLSKAFYDAGLTLYDLLGARHDGGWHRRLSRRRRSTSLRRCDATASAAGSSTTTGSRTTLATRSPWPGRRMAGGGVAVTRVRATGVRSDTLEGVIDALLADGPHDRRRRSTIRTTRGRGCDRRLGGRGRSPVQRRLA